MKFFRCATVFFMVICFGSLRGEASYVQQVGAPYEEIFEASKMVLKEIGIEEADLNQQFILSKWIEDEYTRERSFPFLGDSHKSYQRRYRLRFSFTVSERYTEIVISSEFKYRSADAGHATPWRTMDPVRQEADVERDFFNRILLVIEKNRRSQV